MKNSKPTFAPPCQYNLFAVFMHLVLIKDSLEMLKFLKKGAMSSKVDLYSNISVSDVSDNLQGWTSLCFTELCYHDL